jgi:ArsR family transcriptional regulator
MSLRERHAASRRLPDTARNREASLPSTDARAVADIFRVLGEPKRVAILHALSEAELCNHDIASLVGMTESAVSHQMRELRLLKLVTADKRGRKVYYRLSDSHVGHVLEDTLRHVREGADGA